MADPRPVLVLVTTGPRLYREYLLRSIATRYRVHLVTGSPPTWESHYLDGVSVVPVSAGPAVVSAVQEVGSRRPVAGVLTWAEAQTVNAARAAARLGLVGPSPEAALRCRDKFATRSALAAADVPQPSFSLTGDLGEALVAAEKLGFPVVLKPRAGVASEGVVLVSSAAELVDHFASTSSVPASDVPAFKAPVLVEEFLDGPEISVDCVVRAGEVTPVFLARKEIGFAPFFEEIGHTVSSDDPLLSDEGLRSMLTRTHAALRYTDGWTHSEVKLTAGGPRVIEVNGRMGGDLIPYLGLLASGVDPGLLAASLVCGEPAEPVVPSSRVAGIRFFYPPRESARLTSLEAGDGVVPLVSVGDVVSPPGKGMMEGRVALATAVAGSRPECVAALDLAEASVRFTWA